MSLQVTGKNIRVGESFQTYVEEKLEDAVGKYIGSYLAAHVRVEKERGRFLTSCTVRVRTGLVLDSSGEGTDAYSSADATFEHLEKRLRRYKRRLKSHHIGGASQNHDESEGSINDFIVELPDREDSAESEPIGDHPLVVAETRRPLHRLSVGEAVMRLDLTEESFLVFRNATSGALNVVYRRTDGNIGWIDAAGPGDDPAQTAAGADGRGKGRSADASPGRLRSMGGKSKRGS